jgi:hypothetical protein
MKPQFHHWRRHAVQMVETIVRANVIPQPDNQDQGIITQFPSSSDGSLTESERTAYEQLIELMERCEADVKAKHRGESAKISGIGSGSFETGVRNLRLG